MFTLVVSVEPVAKQRARILKTGHSYTPNKTKKYEDLLRSTFLAYAKKNKIKPSDSPLFLSVEFYLPRPKTNKLKKPTSRPDLDNYLKCVMDAGNDILWKDDSFIVEVSCVKRYADYVIPSVVMKVGSAV